MIATLLTIVIPCKDSVHELKSTIESLISQTRIGSTRVLVLDMGSSDGSFQYASQASVEYSKILKIESINYEDSKILEVMGNIESVYTLTVLPGTNFTSNDFIFDNLNSSMSSGNIFAFTNRSKNIIADIFFPHKRLMEGKIKVRALISPSNFLNSLDFCDGKDLIIDKGIINKNLRIIRGKVSS